MNEALRDWVANVENTYYLIGTAAGPHPYPTMVRDFQSIIGEEAKRQILDKENVLPDALVACIGGGSNALGLFYPFLDDDVDMYGVEAAGLGLDGDEHAASLSKGATLVYFMEIEPIYCKILKVRSKRGILYLQVLIIQVLAQSTPG